jgi:hypothetical protein
MYLRVFLVLTRRHGIVKNFCKIQESPAAKKIVKLCQDQ